MTASAVLLAGVMAGGCATDQAAATKREQVETAQNGLTGEYGAERLQRRNNAGAVAGGRY